VARVNKSAFKICHLERTLETKLYLLWLCHEYESPVALTVWIVIGSGLIRKVGLGYVGYGQCDTGDCIVDLGLGDRTITACISITTG